MYKLSYNLIFKLTVWITVEVIFNLIGIDDLADYSEFILDKKHRLSEIAMIQNYNSTNLLNYYLKAERLFS
jgi:hypothetical protein